MTDSYNRLHNYLRISLTPLCNLRCTYCMPKNGVPRPDPDTLMTDEERIRVVRVLAGLSPVPLKVSSQGEGGEGGEIQASDVRWGGGCEGWGGPDPCGVGGGAGGGSA